MEHQRRAQPTETPPAVDVVLNTAGQPLSEEVRAPLEARFGQDFSRVRVHSDAQAAASASAVGAHAYTVGTHIVFGAGQYRPGSPDGQRLLAHELTHVLQQRDAAATGTPVITDPAGALERQAAEAAVGTGPIAPIAVGRQTIAREPATTKADESEDALARIQGLAMAELLRALERLDYAVRSDERAGEAVGGQRLVLAMRAVAARGSAWEPFEQSHQQELSSLPPDQVADVGTYLRAHDVGGVRTVIADIAAKDIGAAWAGRKQQFLAAASDPSNTLNSAQMYQIWLHYWKDEQVAARAAYQRIETAEAKPDVVGYADKLQMFKAGRRGILSPAYEAAADRVTATDYYTSDLPDVLGWLEAQVDISHNHVTIDQVNRKVPALIKDRTIQQFLWSFLTGFAGGPKADGNSAGLSQSKITSEGEIPLRNEAPPGEKPSADPQSPAGRNSAGRNSAAPEPAGQTPEPERQPPSTSGAEPPAPVVGEEDPGAVGRGLVRKLRAEGKEVIANLGGAGAAHEPVDGINVNNQAVARKDIPNHVKADGADIGTLFEPGSLDGVEGYHMAPGAIDWERAAPGAYRALRSGGRFRYDWRGANYDAQVCAKALKAAGFVDVDVVADVFVRARKP